MPWIYNCRSLATIHLSSQCAKVKCKSHKNPRYQDGFTAQPSILARNERWNEPTSHPSAAWSSQLEATVGVWVGDDRASLNNRGHDRSTRAGGQGLVGSQGVGRVEVLVDDTNHAVLTVVAGGLGTVVPDGGLVLDDDLEDVGGLDGVAGRLEAAEEGLGEGGVRDAGLAKGWLGDGVVLGEEMPLHYVSNLGDDVIGVKDESASAAGDDRVGDTCEGGRLVRGRGCRRRWQSGDNGRRGKGSDETLGEHFYEMNFLNWGLWMR